MKRRLPHIIFFFVLLINAGSAFGQDAGMSDTDIVGDRDNSEPDILILTPGETEVRYIPKASGVYSANDSIALHALDFPMQQAAQRPADKNDKQPPKKDDSILTFNFLYYIIQKYKLQDIID